MSKQLIIPVGIPGSGKTTFLKGYAHENNLVYVSPDDIREQLTGDAGDQRKNKEVWEITKTNVEEALENDASVLVDATFFDPKVRAQFVDLAKKKDAKEIICIHFKTPLALAKTRNENRDRKVPDSVIENMHSKIEEFPPGLKEGFTKILNIDKDGKMVE